MPLRETLPCNTVPKDTVSSQAAVEEEVLRCNQTNGMTPFLVRGKSLHANYVIKAAFIGTCRTDRQYNGVIISNPWHLPCADRDCICWSTNTLIAIGATRTLYSIKFVSVWRKRARPWNVEHTKEGKDQGHRWWVDDDRAQRWFKKQRPQNPTGSNKDQVDDGKVWGSVSLWLGSVGQQDAACPLRLSHAQRPRHRPNKRNKLERYSIFFTLLLLDHTYFIAGPGHSQSFTVWLPYQLRTGTSPSWRWSTSASG